MTPWNETRQSGFTLLEITIVLIIVGLLLGSGIVSLSSQRIHSQRQKAQMALDGMREALIWYTVSNGRLPCPDTDGDGLGNETGGVCDALVGTLPWGEFLNVDTTGTRTTRPAMSGLDPWGRPFIYHMGRAYATTMGWNDAVCADCLITVQEAGGAPLADNAAAVIVSKGQDGHPDSGPTGAPAIVYTQGARDDILIWLSPAELKLPLQRAGKISP